MLVFFVCFLKIRSHNWQRRPDWADGWRVFAPPHAPSVVQKKSQQQSDNTCSIRSFSSVSMKCAARMQGNECLAYRFHAWFILMGTQSIPIVYSHIPKNKYKSIVLDIDKWGKVGGSHFLRNMNICRKTLAACFCQALSRGMTEWLTSICHCAPDMFGAIYAIQLSIQWLCKR